MKKCNGCGEEKPLENYAKRVSSKDGLQTRCRECHGEYTRRHYAENKKYYKAKAAKARVDNRDLVRAAKERPCVDCHVQYPFYMMDFDHLEGEDKAFSLCHNRNFGRKQILAEIAKCEVVCSNCHRRRTWIRSGGEEIEIES